MISSSLTLLHVPTDPTRGKTGKNQALPRGMLRANLEMEEESEGRSRSGGRGDTKEAKGKSIRMGGCETMPMLV